jgi:hypothetical protein
MRLDRNRWPAVPIPAVLVLPFLSLAGGPRAQVQSEAAPVRRPAPALAIERTARLPRAITSFGAARVDRWLYVFGGHVGRAHAHSRENVVGEFHRLDLKSGGGWESLPPGPALQGTALVADSRGRLHRVGGVTATNAADEDAIVPDDRLDVVVGWNLAGGSHGSWHSTSLVADLREEPPVWRELPPIGESRRALALAIHAGKLVALGGMDEDGPLSSVRALDLASGTWSDLPELPGMAFGTAAISMHGQWFATVMDGRLLRLTADRGWQAASTLHTPRFFHRLVPGAREGTVLALGGASRNGHLRTLETVAVAPSPPGPTIHEYRVATPTEIDSRQAVVKCGDELWACGGNRGGDGDRFAPTRFADDSWCIDLFTMTANLRGNLPVHAQSMAAIVAGKRVVLTGGLGVRDDHSVGSLDGVQSLTPTEPKEVARGPRLPMPRTQAELVAHGGKLYLVGGGCTVRAVRHPSAATAAFDGRRSARRPARAPRSLVVLHAAGRRPGQGNRAHRDAALSGSRGRFLRPRFPAARTPCRAHHPRQECRILPPTPPRPMQVGVVPPSTNSQSTAICARSALGVAGCRGG